jgi:PAS domain-containing protein
VWFGVERKEIGEALAGLHCLQPEPLGRTLGVLGSQLTAGLPPDQMVALRANLVGLLESLWSVFFRKARSTILSEQKAIRQALVQELEMTEQVLSQVRSELESRVGRRTAELARVNEDLQLEEEALRASEERWRSLVENAPDFVLAIDRGGRVLFANRPLRGGDGGA